MDTFIRVPATAARNIPELNRAIARLAAELHCVNVGELQRGIGRVVVLDRVKR